MESTMPNKPPPAIAKYSEIESRLASLEEAMRLLLDGLQCNGIAPDVARRARLELQGGAWETPLLPNRSGDE
jgi:hypothetical protein